MHEKATELLRETIRRMTASPVSLPLICMTIYGGSACLPSSCIYKSQYCSLQSASLPAIARRCSYTTMRLRDGAVDNNPIDLA